MHRCRGLRLRPGSTPASVRGGGLLSPGARLSPAARCPQVFIAGYPVMTGAPGGLLFGHDSFGNACGKENPPVEGAPLSGQDMTLKK